MTRYLKFPVAALALVALVVLPAALANAAPEERPLAQVPGKTHAPQTPLPKGDLRIKSHDVKVVINNGFATTQVDQVLVNAAPQDIEAAWAFPLPKEAALSELSVESGGKRYIGEVVEKQRAREIYQAEQQAGRGAALAEQHEYFHYQVKITRVPAGGEVAARIVYYQALEIESGVGRYLYPMEEGNTDDLQRAFWTMDRASMDRLSFDVTLKTAFPVDKLHSPSHAGLQFKPKGEDTWHARLDQPGAKLDRDFILLYRLKPDVPARIELLTNRVKGEAEGTFMAVVTPGADLAPIEGGTDWAFVLDVSGSMQGEKIRVLQRGVAKALRGLKAQDRFQLFSFNASARQLTAGWQPVEAGALTAAQALIDGMHAGGGTNVHSGLSLAYRDLDADRPTGIILVSDGVANVGPHHYRELIGLARKHDVRIFTFAIGNSANLMLMKDMADQSGGTSTTVATRDEIGAHLLLARDRMTHQALHGVQFELTGATVVYPKTPKNLYLGQQLVVLGRYDRTGKSKLAVKAKISGKPVAWTLDVDLPAEDATNPELERLYALTAIEDLQRESWLRTGDGGEASNAIVDMALRYSLVTDYTSMIVVADAQKKQYGIGNANAERRAKEQAAAKRRAAKGNSVRRHVQGQPLAGKRAAHAPSRWTQQPQPQGGGGSSGGGGGGGGAGGGALGPLHVLLVAGMAAVAMRRRRKQAS
ncbi:MAG: VIT domain-containing protein [Planctomycetota bacterium]|nr:VIT domain-containing protein [Planctomycetota bacterium]